MSWIYIIAVIIFAIVSNVNKAQKGNRKSSKRGAMPTFGGEGKDIFTKMRGYMQPEEKNRPDVRGSGFPNPGAYAPTENRTYSSRDGSGNDNSPAFAESPLMPSPDYETGEGLSMEYSGAESLDTRMKETDDELDRLYAAFNQIGAVEETGNPSRTASGKKSTNASGKKSSGVDLSQLQAGLQWAEILGPPRSKRPYHSHKQS